ncbi:phage tail tape measure protein [Methylobacterium sp. E-041]|uniref:phage tail tape measure protein n=1 Tax=Methylobacterium sp. E-041 TaxID=2836573 RepID=UPI001FBAB6F1|nr:phage tail tape measure protein [Methylobacterium sp. E-041]MCJ2108027.1 phage tail tape measure protein [Methylobacterium sp. E-041]
MGRIIEAKAVISAEDRTGAVFDRIAKKFKDVGKGAKVSAEIDRFNKSLNASREALKAIDSYSGQRSAFYDTKRKMQEARAGVDQAARALANAAKPTRELEQNMRRAQAAADAATAAYERQKAAVLSSRAALSKGGVAVSGLISEQRRIAAAIDQTTAAMKRQSALERSERGLAAGMGVSGRREADRIAAGRRVADGMGASGRAARADRERMAEEAAAARAQRRADRAEAAKVLGAGAAIAAGHKVKSIAKGSIEAAAEFDLATRKQKVFTDIGDDDQANLLKQAKQIGQETQFSNIDVVKAQTAAMQGLPASFAPSLKAQVAEGIVGNVRNFSTLMEVDLKDGTEIIRGYLQQSGKDISTKEKALAEANKATNQLVKMAKIGGMDGEDVKNFSNYAIASATASGLSTDATMSLGALARRGGLRGDVAGVAMRSMAGKIVSPTADGIAALNAAGIKHSDFVHMPDRLSTDALEGQFQNKMGKGFTPEIRKRVEAINGDKGLIGDRDKYTQAIVLAVADMLGKTKDGTVRASDAKVAAKAVGKFHKLSAQSVDAEGLLDAAMKSSMTLPQLNAWLTDKHGGKGSITQRQWDEFKASKEAIGHAGDDPNWAKKKADEVFAGLGGSVENLKGSFENLILTIGNANAPLVKLLADKSGSALDGFSNLPVGAQQGLSLGAGAGAMAASAWGSLVLLKTLLGFGSKLAAPAAAAAGGGAGATAAGSTVGGAAAAAGGGAAFGLTGITAGVAAGAAFGAYATAQQMPKLAAEQGAKGIDYATGGATEANPMAGMGPARPYLQDWWKSTMPSWLGGTPGGTIPVDVKALPSSSDASGQVKALGNTLDGAATASATAANGGKPIEATVKPDQITARVTDMPPLTGTMEAPEGRLVGQLTILPSPLLTAKLDQMEGSISAMRGTIGSSGGRPAAVSMPGAATTPGAAK